MNIIFKQHTKLDAEVAAAWRALWQISPYAHFFNSPEWYKAYVTHDAALPQLIITAWRGDTLVAVFPLVRARHFGLKVVRSPGGKFLDRSTLLIAKNEIAHVRPLMQYAHKIAPLYLAEVPEEIMRASAGVSSAYIVPASLTIYGEVTNDPTNLMRRKNRKRFERTLKKIVENISFEYVRADEPGRLDTVFDIEQASYKIFDGRALFTDRSNKELFWHLVKEAGELCKVAFILYKGRPIAHELGFQIQGTFMSYHTAYRREFTSFMPGKVLIFHLISHLHRIGVRTIDFSRGENSLKRQFAAHAGQQYDMYITNSFIIRWYFRGIVWLKHSVLYTIPRDFYKYLYRLVAPVVVRFYR